MASAATSLQSSGMIRYSDIRSLLGITSGLSRISLLGRPTGLPSTSTIRLGNFYSRQQSLRPGLYYRCWTGYFADNVNFFNTNTADTAANSFGSTLNIGNINSGTNNYRTVDGQTVYSVEWFGYFYADVTGTWSFTLASDDASYMWLGNNALSGFATANANINNGGTHGVVAVSTNIALTAGTYYPIRIQFGQNGGGADCQFTFIPPSGSSTSDGTNRYFCSTGATASFPALNALMIKHLTGTNTDGMYHTYCTGTTGTPTFCLMDSTRWNGGGWMMMMKATRGTTFNFSSTYWTTVGTTLNPSSTNRNDGDAKFATMDYSPVGDIICLWPDVGFTNNPENLFTGAGTWIWHFSNLFSTRTTFRAGCETTNSRVVSSTPTSFHGFSSSIWSFQSPAQALVIGGTGVVNGNNTLRLGFAWNENGANDFTTMDAYGGIGMDSRTNYSAGDAFFCCGSVGLNRTMRVEIYGR